MKKNLYIVTFSVKQHSDKIFFTVKNDVTNSTIFSKIKTETVAQTVKSLKD